MMDNMNPEAVPGNEFDIGNNIIAVRIPNLPGRISRKRRKDEFGHETVYIELIVDRFYDPEKRQCRNKRISIGIDISHIHDGLMLPGKKYYQYFDHDGRPLYGPKFPENMQSRKETDEQNDTDAEGETEEDQEAPEEAAAEPAEEPKTGPEARTDPATEEEKKQRAEDDRKEQEAWKKAEEGLNELKRQRMEDRIDFLKSILRLYNDYVSTVAEKKPFLRMTAYQVKRINELLRDLRRLFRGLEHYEYLELADEPWEGTENGDEEEEHRISYGDMAVLLAPYEQFFTDYLFGRLHRMKSQN